jgi:hypothetical protein
MLGTVHYALLSSSRYNGNFVAKTVVRLKATKFKFLLFSVTNFVMSNISKICIFMI